jgi:hypothetical protein
VVIGAGRRSVPVARWIRAQSRGRARLVHVGGAGGGDAGVFDAVVTPACAHLWPHPHRVETVAPLTRAGEEPLPRAGARERGAGRGRLVRRWIEKRAHERPRNRRGTPRPQQGLEYLCARLIERGIVAPVPDLRERRPLGEREIARPFCAPPGPSARPSLRETREVAHRVEELLGLPAGVGPCERG